MAVTINYYWPVATPGTTTPAPSNQAVPTIPTPPATSRFNSVTATITDDGATTSAVIVTNFGLTAGELTALWPKVQFEPTLPGGNTRLLRGGPRVQFGHRGIQPDNQRRGHRCGACHAANRARAVTGG